MSVVGTGVAAGVAQASLQAQQVARDRDRKKTEEDQSARRLRESFEAHLHQLEDAHQVEAIDRLTIEGHLPQDRLEQNSDKSQGEDPTDTDSGDEPNVDTPTSGQVHSSAKVSDSEGTLYHHLDVKG